MSGTANERIYGRSWTTLAAGETAAEIELAALDEARRFFGPEVRLEIEPNYEAGIYGDGKTKARVTIREVVGGTDGTEEG